MVVDTGLKSLSLDLRKTEVRLATASYFSSATALPSCSLLPVDSTLPIFTKPVNQTAECGLKRVVCRFQQRFARLLLRPLDWLLGISIQKTASKERAFCRFSKTCSQMSEVASTDGPYE